MEKQELMLPIASEEGEGEEDEPKPGKEAALEEITGEKIPWS